MLFEFLSENQQLQQQIASLSATANPKPSSQENDTCTTFVTSAASIQASHYKDAFEHSTMGMAIASPGGAFVQGNQIFCQHARTTPQDLTNMSIFSLTAPHQLSTAFDTLSEWLQGDCDGTSMELISSLPGLKLHVQKLRSGGSDRGCPHTGLLVSLVEIARRDSL